MITDQEATQLVRGLVFAVQKARSDMRESMGDGETADALLEDLHPWLFGEKSLLPALLKWQTNCEHDGKIGGGSLYNFVRMIQMKDPMLLELLPVWGYAAPEPEVLWAVQTWTWVP